MALRFIYLISNMRFYPLLVELFFALKKAETKLDGKFGLAWNDDIGIEGYYWQVVGNLYGPLHNDADLEADVEQSS